MMQEFFVAVGSILLVQPVAPLLIQTMLDNYLIQQLPSIFTANKSQKMALQHAIAWISLKSKLFIQKNVF